MIVLKNDTIYINQDKPLPFICPQCGDVFPYSAAPFVWCPTCSLYTGRREFELAARQVLPN